MTSVSPALPSRSALTFLWAAIAATGAVAAGLAVTLRRPAPPSPPVLGTLPDFVLVERSDRALSRRDLLGRAWVADFVFTRCGGVCPAMTARMARLRRTLPANVTFVSFTVDPEHDTPAVLSRHADSVGAGTDWLWVTGEQSVLHDLATQGFKLAAQENPPERQADGRFLHSSRFVLVDQHGRIRGYYDGADEEAVGALRRDVAALGGGA